VLELGTEMLFLIVTSPYRNDKKGTIFQVVVNIMPYAMAPSTEYVIITNNNKDKYFCSRNLIILAICKDRMTD
jgi:hypothetical protein